MDSWPVSLPDPQASDCNYAPQANVIRTEMAAGIAKVRRRFTSVPSDVTLRLVVNRAQAQTLEDFAAITLKDVLPFEWKDFRKPFGPENVAIYRFKSRPKFTPRPSGMTWNATLELELFTAFQGTFLTDLEGLST